MQDIYTSKMPHIALINDARDALHTASILGMLYDLSQGIWNRSFDANNGKHVIQGVFTSQAKSEALNVYLGKIVAEWMQAKGGRAAAWTKGTLAADHFTNDTIMNRLKAIEFNDNDSLFKMVITRLLGIDNLVVELALAVTPREKAEALVAYLALRHDLSPTAPEAVLDYVDAVDLFERLLAAEKVPHDAWFFEAIWTIIEANEPGGVVQGVIKENPLDMVTTFIGMCPIVEIAEQGEDAELTIAAALEEHKCKILVVWPDGRRENRRPPRKPIGDLLAQFQGEEFIEEALRESSITIKAVEPEQPTVVHDALYPRFRVEDAEFFVGADLVTPVEVCYGPADPHGREPHLTQFLKVPTEVPNYLGLCQTVEQSPWGLSDEVNANSLIAEHLLVSFTMQGMPQNVIFNAFNIPASRFAPGSDSHDTYILFLRQTHLAGFSAQNQWGQNVGEELFRDFKSAGFEPLFGLQVNGTFNRQRGGLKLGESSVGVTAMRNLDTGDVVTYAGSIPDLRDLMESVTEVKVTGVKMHQTLSSFHAPIAVDTVEAIAARMQSYFDEAAVNRAKFFDANPDLHSLLTNSQLKLPQIVEGLRESGLAINWPTE